MRTLTGITLLSVFPAAYLLHPWLLKDTLPVCLFRLTTGSACCFCGLTRAVASATHGEFATAFGYNPLWGGAAVVILGLAGTALRDGIFGSNSMDRVGRLWQVWGWTFLALAAVATALRI